jgi:hypothetical protein
MTKNIFKVAIFAGLLVGPIITANPFPAQAAQQDLPPQVLGLIATAMPVPLRCADGTCSVRLSSFCLQEDRPVPGEGQRYDVAGMGDVTLIVTRTDGRVSEFSAAGLVEYVSDGDFTRVRATMDQSRLASLDATEVAVRVHPMVSLLPRTEGPVSAEVAARDEETAFGAPRMLAEGFFKPGTTRTDATLAIRRMIASLPASGSQIGGATPALRKDVWRRVTEGGGFETLSEGGVKRAKGALDRCGAFADMGVKLTLRGCLENTHDKTVREVTEEYWKTDPQGY